MKKRVGRFSALLLAAALVLAACGDRERPENQQDTAESQTTEQQDAGQEAAGQPDDDAKEDEWAALREQMGFYVEGSALYDANGNPFILRGINHAHCWYEDNVMNALQGIAGTGSNCIRIVLADGQQWTATSAKMVEALISRCKTENLIAILEVHDATGYTDKESLMNAARYFVDLKDSLIGQEDYVIINIANEWQGSSESKIWKEAYLEAIPMLREAGLAHTIMIDCSGWGQYGKCMQDGGEELLAADPLGNVMFSVHMYGTAGGSEESIEKNLRYATDLGLCVCVGEFGYTHTDGDVQEDFLMQYCQDNRIGYIAWSWKGNGGGVEYLDLAEDWNGDTLSADWGEIVVNGANGIRETSRMCTVFE